MVVAIIGGGPAGMACGIQLVRQGIRPMIFEKDSWGGILKNAHMVENYLGMRPLSGDALVDQMIRQFFQFDMYRVNAEVTALEYDESVKKFYIDCRNADDIHTIYEATHVVIASGTQPISWNLHQDISAAMHTRIYSVVYPLKNQVAKDILIIGAGDAAFDYALTLTPQNRVYICNRRNAYRALPDLYRRIHDINEIVYWNETQVVRLTHQKDERIKVDMIWQDTHKTQIVDYIIPAIGRKPAVSFVSPSLFTLQGMLEASGRLFWVGDVVNEAFRQVAIATGDGIRIAMKLAAEERLV
jgi:thioredoxin reductase (NADPH)